MLRRLPLVVVVLLAAAALGTGRSLGWGGVEAPDGTRYKVSPVGVSHVLHPGRAYSPTRDCRWSPPSGDPELCAPAAGAVRAVAGLRLVLRLVDLATVLTLASGALLLARRFETSAAPVLLLAAATLLGVAAGRGAGQDRNPAGPLHI